jgi:hypothetical protein
VLVAILVCFKLFAPVQSLANETNAETMPTEATLVATEEVGIETQTSTEPTTVATVEPSVTSSLQTLDAEQSEISATGETPLIDEPTEPDPPYVAAEISSAVCRQGSVLVSFTYSAEIPTTLHFLNYRTQLNGGATFEATTVGKDTMNVPFTVQPEVVETATVEGTVRDSADIGSSLAADYVYGATPHCSFQANRLRVM